MQAEDIIGAFVFTGLACFGGGLSVFAGGNELPSLGGFHGLFGTIRQLNDQLSDHFGGAFVFRGMDDQFVLPRF